MLFAPRQEVPVKYVVGLGHPGKTSWDVEYELKDIRSFYKKAKMLFDTSATMEHCASLKYDILHIAADYLFDRDVPDNSSMLLSDGATPDGLRQVSLGEILALRAPQTLIFSNISPVPGGLARYAPLAFLANGSQTVITTMWQGERRVKRYFGEVFYTSVMAGVPSAEAYDKAMIALARKDEFSALYRWGLYYRFGR